MVSGFLSLSLTSLWSNRHLLQSLTRCIAFRSLDRPPLGRCLSSLTWRYEHSLDLSKSQVILPPLFFYVLPRNSNTARRANLVPAEHLHTCLPNNHVQHEDLDLQIIYLPMTTSHVDVLALSNDDTKDQIASDMDPSAQILLDLHGRVCGCPEFWSQRPSPTLGEFPHDPMHQLLCKLNARCPRRAHSAAALTMDWVSDIAPLSNFPPQHPALELEPPLAPSKELKETCIFWYHGNCRSGDACKREHKLNHNWPITLPPGYAHGERHCRLRYCPVRTDLVKFMNKYYSTSQPYGFRDEEQVAPHSKLSPDSPLSHSTSGHTIIRRHEKGANKDEIGERKAKGVGNNDQEVNVYRADKLDANQHCWLGISKAVNHDQTSFKTASDPLPGVKHASSDLRVGYGRNTTNPFPESTQIGPKTPREAIFAKIAADCGYKDAKEVAEIIADATWEGRNEIMDLCSQLCSGKITFDVVSAVLGIGDDATDTSKSFTPLSPKSSPRACLPPPTSISHLGTRSRKNGPTVHRDTGYGDKRSCAESIRPGSPSLGNYHLQSEPPSPFLSSYSHRKRRESKRKTAPGADNTSKPKRRRVQSNAGTIRARQRPARTMCFFWYHQGFCRPRSGASCYHLHDMVREAQVDWPANRRAHDPKCSLPLCPIRLARKDVCSPVVERIGSR